MSVHVSSDVWKITGITPSQKLILLKLADHADDDGRCWPSIRRMAVETCLDKATVCRLLRAMETAGWIEREQRPFQNTVYRLRTSQIVPESLKTSGRQGGVVAPRDHPIGDPLVAPRDQGGRTTRPGVVAPCDTNHHRTAIEPPSSKGSIRLKRDKTADELSLANLVELDLFASDGLKEAWERFKAYRADRARMPLVGEKRAPWTERASLMAKATVERIVSKWGEAAALEQLAKTVTRRWIDIYEPKNVVDKRPSTETMSVDDLKNF